MVDVVLDGTYISHRKTTSDVKKEAECGVRGERWTDT